MKIQSLSLAVPAPCLNQCRFCVAQMHNEDYQNQLDKNKPFWDLYEEDFERRLLFARDNGCNVLMITGNGEPLLNRGYLEVFSLINKKLPSPFRWIELQTSGTTLIKENTDGSLDESYLRFLRNTVWVNTISLSLSDMFSSKNNADINQTKAGFEVNIDNLCKSIKKYDFTLRLSLNMTSVYDSKSVEEIFERAKELGADQITFRVLYTSGDDTPQDLWIKNNRCDEQKITQIQRYIKNEGKPLEILPFGATKYSVHEMSVVLDDDCMSRELKDAVKYLVLRPNCKLYSQWDDKGSLIF